GEDRDPLAVEVAPGGLAMEEEHRRTSALVDVVKAKAIDFEIARSEGPSGKSGKALVGSAQDLHWAIKAAGARQGKSYRRLSASAHRRSRPVACSCHAHRRPREPDVFVHDVRKSIDWYVRVLGFRVVFEHGGYAGVALGPAEIHLPEAA